MGCDFLLKDKGTLSAAKLLPAVLSVIAGSCDVIGFLGLGGLFTAHVTGNLVILAAHILSGEAAQVAPMLSVPVFMVALGLTRLVAAGCERAGLAPLRPLLALQLILPVAVLAFGVAADHDMSKRQGMAMLGDLVALITKHLKKGERIKIAGFGILQVRKRAARMGRNPATGEAIKIKASKKVAFRAAKDLKTAIAA